MAGHAADEHELIPRFTAKHSTKTSVGAVGFTVTREGNNGDFDMGTRRALNMGNDAAVKKIVNQLLTAKLVAS